MIPIPFPCRFKTSYVFLCLASLAFLMPFPPLCHGHNTMETFFQNTDYELNVYRINGKFPGKTLLIIGGIQGDEPGGFLSADLYADMELVRGNLIVVPRANFYSIILNRRQINEDMNRKFSGSSQGNYEAQVVTILKQLMSESDCLLNLHDGSGFYRDTWLSEMKNPARYGQSIIVDSENYTDLIGNEVPLGEMARRAISKINEQIDNSDYLFRLNNHRTSAPDSMHPEQRKSATYYALYECGIPAFGIETSKSLPLETRIYHHKLAVNSFMDMLDITPEIPGIGLEQPQIKYAVVKINDCSPVVVANGETLHIRSHDTIKIIHIEGNYSRGLSADIEGYGSVNDVNKAFAVDSPTRVLIKKDHILCGTFHIAFGQRSPSGSLTTTNHTVVLFKVKINGKEKYYPNGSHVDIVRGDLLELVDAITTPDSLAGITCNFKGFVGNKKSNTGEDRGYIIDTAKDLWKRYSLYDKGRVYQVIVSENDNLVIGRLFFDIHSPRFEYLLLCLNEADKRWVAHNEPIRLNLADSMKIVDIKSNVSPERVTMTIRGNNASLPIAVKESITGERIATFFEGASAEWGIHIGRDTPPFASLPLTIMDYRPVSVEMDLLEITKESKSERKGCLHYQ